MAEEALLYVTDSATGGSFDSSTSIKTEAATYGGSLGPTIQPTSIVSPTIFGDELSATLHCQSALADGSNMQLTCGFQMEDVFCHQASHILQEGATDLSNRSLLDMGSVSIETRLIFHGNAYSQTPQMGFQDNGTIDPTHLYPDIGPSECTSSAGVVPFESGPVVLSNNLCSRAAQAVDCQDSSLRLSDDCSMSEQTSLSGTTVCVSQSSSSSRTTTYTPIDEHDVPIAESRVANTCRRKKPCLHLGYGLVASKGSKRRANRPRTKSRPKHVTEDGIAVVHAAECVCGTVLADGSICLKKFQRLEHRKRHIQSTHDKDRMNNCPDQRCKKYEDSFNGRADNLKAHIINTHIKWPRQGKRNDRWTREEACKWGYIGDWEEWRGENAARSEAQKQQKASKRGKSRAKIKSLQSTAMLRETKV